MVLVYYINFGPHGPRAEKIKDGWQIAGGVATCVAIAMVLFWVLRQYSIHFYKSRLMIVTPPPPRTLTREWQEAATERMKELGIEPISGPSSEGYKVIPSKLWLTFRDLV
jgi:cytochrome c oxidase subunit 4